MNRNWYNQKANPALNTKVLHIKTKNIHVHMWGGLAQWLASRTTDQGVPGSRPGRGTVCCGLEQVKFTHCLVLVKPRKPWTDDSD